MNKFTQIIHKMKIKSNRHKEKKRHKNAHKEDILSDDDIIFYDIIDDD